MNDRQRRVAKAILSRNEEAFRQEAYGISFMNILLDGLVVVPELPQSAQRWWYDVMAPQLTDLAELDVTPEERAENQAWSDYQRPNAKVLEPIILELLRQSGGLKFDELLERLEAFRSRLPNPTSQFTQLVTMTVFWQIGQTIWQTDDLLLHA